MATIFTKILSGDIPGNIIYRDDICSAFLTIEPQAPGHVLLVPNEEVSDVLDLSNEQTSHIFQVAKNIIGPAIQKTTDCSRVGYLIEGFGVPDHMHLHLVPINHPGILDSHMAKSETPENLTKMAERIISYI